MNKLDFNIAEIKLFKKNLPLREIKLSREKASLILEAVRFYYFNTERIENEMKQTGSETLTYSAFTLKRELQELMDILYGRE